MRLSRPVIHSRLLSLCLIVLSATSLAQDDESLDLFSQFAAKYRYTDMAISPNGERALIKHAIRGNLYELQILNKGSKAFETVVSEGEGSIGRHHWLDDHHFIYTIETTMRTDVGHWVMFDLKTGKKRQLRKQTLSKSLNLHDLISGDPNHVLMQMYGGGDEGLYTDLYQMNIKSREFELVYKNPGRVINWITDEAGTPRVAMTFESDASSRLLRLDAESGQWSVLEHWDDFEAAFSPVSVSGNRLYITSQMDETNTRQNHHALRVYDLDQRKITETLWAPAGTDVTGMITHQRKLVGIKSDAGYPQRHYFEPILTEMAQGLKTAMPEKQVDLVSCSTDRTDCIIHAWSDTDPGQYYWFDREAFSLVKVAERAPHRQTEHNVRMDVVDIPNRNDMSMPSLLMMPETSKGLVLWVHGGPHSHQSWGYDTTFQFLAQSGYSVLAPNYRGSTGFGASLQVAGYGQWGTGIIDDLADAARWAIKQGLAKPDRVCIMGYGYGGYATLMSLGTYPELYACGISQQAPTDLLSVRRHLGSDDHVSAAVFNRSIGTDASRSGLKELSPKLLAKSIQSALLLIYSGQEGSQAIRHAKEMYSALRYRDVSVDLITRQSESGDFDMYINRKEMFEALQEFLAEHLTAEES